MRYSDEELLKLVGEERKRSIGFGEGDGGELVARWERALAYMRGEMSDLPSLPNRSSAVDTTVSDAIETFLPDAMEVFVGGDDVATFTPQGEEDEDRAREESDFVNHVIFTENEGFQVLYAGIKDAAVLGTGIFHWFWEEEEKDETLAQGLNEMQATIGEMQAQGAQREQGDDGTFSLKSTKLHGKVRIQAVPPEDFTVAADTVSLRDTTYCAMRARPRVQELIARGIDPKEARALPRYTRANDAMDQARDMAGEHETLGEGVDDLRTVEVIAHYVRLADEEGGDKLCVYRVITDGESKIMLGEREKVEGAPFAAIVPFPNPHRFHGQSLAEKLIPPARVKTALLRAGLDEIYFGLNQRNEVAMTRANEFTIADLLRNEPGVPVRSQSGDAVRPISAGGLNADTWGALEYAATMAETASGIVRNAQGLNPDTLHDTAKGALVLITAAQKRVRFICRIFAETGLKELYLGVHCLLRSAHTKDYAPASAKLGNTWKTINPSEWPERCAMAVHVGVGSAGKEHDLMVSSQRLELMERLAALPGAMGTLIDGGNIHRGLTAWERAAGTKDPDAYWSDPAQAAPQPPKPDPEVEKAQAELALKREEATANVQLAQEKAQVDAETTAQKHQMDAEAAERKAQRDHEARIAEIQINGELKRYEAEQTLILKRETTAAELALKRELLTAELEMKRETAMLNAQVARETGMAKVAASSSVSEVQPGGDPG